MTFVPGAAAATASAVERMRKEEEEMTGYTREDLTEGWEFKILRSMTNAFKDPERLRVEIVSRSFMNTRSIAEDKLFIPVTGSHAPAVHATATEPEAIVFDKAEHAQLLEDLAEQHRLMGGQISELEQRREGAEGSTEQRDLEARLERLRARRERIERFLGSERERERERD